MLIVKPRRELEPHREEWTLASDCNLQDHNHCLNPRLGREGAWR